MASVSSGDHHLVFRHPFRHHFRHHPHPRLGAPVEAPLDEPDAGSVDSVGTFSLAEPGEGQRWSTWPAITPTERGPRPHPDWLVTSAAAFDTELGIVKTGKEADVFLIERGVPDDAAAVPGQLPARRQALPRPRASATSTAQPRIRRADGCGTPATPARSTRIVQLRPGGRVRAWAFAEFVALCRAFEAGVPVPYPVQIELGTEMLMEFIGDGRTAAPRLAQTRRRAPSSSRCSTRSSRSCACSPARASRTATSRPTTCSCTTSASW